MEPSDGPSARRASYAPAVGATRRSDVVGGGRRVGRELSFVGPEQITEQTDRAAAIGHRVMDRDHDADASIREAGDEPQSPQWM